MESTMEWERLSGQMALCIKVSGKTVRSMAEASSLVSMAQSMRVNGSKASITAKASCSCLRVRYMQACLKTANSSVDGY